MSNSPFAAGISRLTQIPVSVLNDKFWPVDVRDFCSLHEAKLLIVDTFPFGLRGEWLYPVAGKRMIYTARRLKLDAYLQRIQGLATPGRHLYEMTLICEPITAVHREMLTSLTARFCMLPGRIQLTLAENGAVPVELETLFETQRVHLVVHSGPDREVQDLVKMAQTACLSDSDATPVIITPKKKAKSRIPGFDYFPAAQLYPKAAHIYTGAGYNSMAETANYRHKHSAVAFYRRFDDQAGRLKAEWNTALNGADAAAEAIADLL